MASVQLSHHWHRIAAGITGTAMLCTSLGAYAQDTHYTDVEAGVWYEAAATALLESGALDQSESRLRPNDLATRAEVLKLLVNVYGEDLAYPATPSFSDVSRSAWYYPYVEASARAGWVKGDDDCYGKGLRVCTARPGDRVNRAEMAVLLKRAFRLSRLNLAPDFPDNARSEWYYDPIQTAADHCILEGDGGTGRVRPASSMNRAEMVVMFHRASKGMRYGDECGHVTQGSISAAAAIDSRTVRVTFNVDLDANRIDDLDLYALENTDGSDIDISDVMVVSARSVDLELQSSLEDNETYRVSVSDMRTERGMNFDDSQTFMFDSDDVPTEAAIESISVRDSDTVRVRFNEDVEASFADDASRYMVELVSNSSDVDVDTVVVVDDRTVDLNLESVLSTGVSYRVTVDNMQTEDGDDFDDSMTFSSAIAVNVTIESATALSATRLRLTFSEDLDEARAEETIRYRVNGFDGDLDIDSVGLVDDNVVEIVLDESLQAQGSYTVTTTNLMTSGDATFTDDIVFVYAPSNISFTATLNGVNEVPPVVTTATGTGSFTLTSTGLQYDITLRSISGAVITGAHFHRGDVGINGAVLENISFNTTTLRATGTWADLTAEERDLLFDQDIYVNVHTNAYPNGEIRGQVLR